MQQNVRLITFPIFIFTTITNLAESCPWKKAILRPLGMVSRKKVAVLLDYVQMRGGALPKFFIGSIWGGEGGGDPCPIFLAHWH